MGLFSSETVTTVSTTVSRVIEDKALPSSVKAGVLTSIIEDDGQPVEHAMENLATGVGLRAHSMHNYGRDHYLYGLPVSTVHDATSGSATVQAIIEEEVGGLVTMDYYHFGALNNLHVGWFTLFTEHGYVQASNQLGVLSTSLGVPVYLKDLRVVVTEATLLELSNGSLDQWGTPATAGASIERPEQPWNIGVLRAPSPFEVDPGASTDYVRVDYSWIAGGSAHTDSFAIPLTGYDVAKDFYQAKYTRSTGEVGYWLYQAGAGTHEALDVMYAPDFSDNGNYFPWTYFRYNKVSGAADTGSDNFLQSVKMGKYLGMDYEAVTTTIHENPGIADVEQAMLMMAVPANTTNMHELHYLFDYFNEVYDRTGGALKPKENSARINALFGRTTGQDGSILIQDARFKMSLGFRRIFKKKVVGNLGEVGTYAMAFGTDTVTETGINTETGLPVYWTTPINFHAYRHQITDALYEEVKITNLKTSYFIFESYAAVANATDAILLIPIDRSITGQYPLPIREILYARSLHYIFNSRVLTEVEWYQQEWFSTFMMVVSIAVTLFNPPAGMALFLATASAEAILVFILIQVLIRFVVGLVIKLFVKLVGVKFALLVAVAAAVAGAYQAIDAGSIAGAPWAQELLKLSSSLSSGVGEAIQGNFLDLMADAKDFGKFAKEKTALLDQANDLLNGNNLLSPLTIFGEKPDDYYNRTVHSGNIGILGIDAISSFVDISLTLPKLNDTVGN